jgi:hypothetical protein
VTKDDSATLRELARQCRCLARGASTREVAVSLEEMGSTYERRADAAQAAEAAAAESEPASRSEA